MPGLCCNKLLEFFFFVFFFPITSFNVRLLFNFIFTIGLMVKMFLYFLSYNKKLIRPSEVHNLRIGFDGLT